MGKARRSTSKSKDGPPVGDHEMKLDIPKALADAGPYAIWQKGGPGPLLRKLSNERVLGEATLTSEELADLVEHFRDEPLPESLRSALLAQLRGKRIRRQGAPKGRQTDLEVVELLLLPRDYEHALKEAAVEREELRKCGRKPGSYDDPNRLPTLSSLACNKIREWLPTLRGLSDRSIQNLVSRGRAILAEIDDAEATSPAPETPKAPS